MPKRIAHWMDAATAHPTRQSNKYLPGFDGFCRHSCTARHWPVALRRRPLNQRKQLARGVIGEKLKTAAN